MVGGFMACGTPEVLIDALVEKNAKDLTIICNDVNLYINYKSDLASRNLFGVMPVYFLNTV
ncbi:CoA-transferase [Clostridium estertheticum]|uniref:CoA-transferase n=1 Tax=Clostridium estertheticum TaxID=238834 RepID=UPI00398CFDD4